LACQAGGLGGLSYSGWQVGNSNLARLFIGGLAGLAHFDIPTLNPYQSSSIYLQQYFHLKP